MRAVKNNKEYDIDDTQKKSYQDRGFDIKNDEGDVIAYGRGKTVPYSEYAALKNELEDLKKESDSADNEEVIEILRWFANEYGIDLGKSSTVSGIVKKIKENRTGVGE